MRYYVGITSAGVREVFRTGVRPTTETHGHQYGCVIGPFRTKRGATYMATLGAGNPHCRCVEDAERLASLMETQSILCDDFSRHLARRPS